jgi:hypothetical protein
MSFEPIHQFFGLCLRQADDAPAALLAARLIDGLAPVNPLEPLSTRT